MASLAAARVGLSAITRAPQQAQRCGRASPVVRTETREMHLTPGTFRTQPEEQVTVGRCQPPSPERLAPFIAHFEQRYQLEPLGRGQSIMPIAGPSAAELYSSFSRAAVLVGCKLQLDLV
jgi:hypothetical protein